MLTRNKAPQRALIAVTVAAAAVSATAVLAATKFKPLTNAVWDLTAGQHNQDVQFSPNQKTRTDRLPPPSSITSDYLVRLKVEYGQGEQIDPNMAIERASPPGAQVTCYPDPPFSGSCRAKANWLRSLTQDATVRLRVKNTSNAVHMLDWVFIAPPHLVFLDRIEGPASLLKGNVADFSLVLAQPAPQGGVEVDYQVDPGNCFGGAQGARGAATQPPKGTIAFNQGEQYKTVTLSSLSSCTSGNAILKTWAHEKRDQTPYYKTKNFALTNPRR
jgi:hypothetical protein